MGRRVLKIVLPLVAAPAMVAVVAVAPNPIHNRLASATPATRGVPPA